MEIKSETKSLPRNRKCGNCRYFEPAPLWRKGWCRNPRLYDRRANHLVDATVIDCEQVFRARIYWEPIPFQEAIVDEANEPTRSAPFSADSGGRTSKLPADNSLRPSGGRPVIVRREVAPDARFVKKQHRYRKWLLENIPYYDKLDGPIHSINYRVVIPWLLVLVLLVFILMNVVSNKNKSTQTALLPPTTATSVTVGPVQTAGITTQPANTPVTVAKGKTAPPTATLSNTYPTATIPPVTPTTTPVVQARVINAPKGLRLRKTPCTDDTNPNCKVLASIPVGTIVTVTGGFVVQEGIQWWQVSYNGQNGYAAKDYLQQLNT